MFLICEPDHYALSLYNLFFFVKGKSMPFVKLPANTLIKNTKILSFILKLKMKSF